MFPLARYNEPHQKAYFLGFVVFKNQMSPGWHLADHKSKQPEILAAARVWVGVTSWYVT